ncbi:MAG: thioredoxin [Clostridium sp.]|uniref:thioredoxin n=1 Tax=Clostridium sp. TaxID=1506 RepID=UPI0030249CA2
MSKIVNASEFSNEIKNNVVVVDFFADWCQPCKMLAPIFEELKCELEGKAKFVKVNIDNSQDIAMKYNVASIPTIMVFKDGEKVDSLVGFVPKEKIKARVENHI